MNATPEACADATLTLSQGRRWFLDQFEQDALAHRGRWIFRLCGKLDGERFRAACESVIRRHEILRTVFPAEHGRPVARIREPAPFSLTPGDAAPDRFDPARGPLFAGALRSLSDELHEFTWTAHRMIFDESAAPSFASELAAAYRGEIPQSVVSFRETVEEEREFLASGEGQKRLAFWKQYLAAPLATLQYPLDRARPAVQTFRCGRRVMTLDRKVTREIAEIAAQRGSDLEAALMTAYAALLHRHTHQSELALGWIDGARRELKSREALGPNQAVSVLRIAVDREGPWVALLKHIEFRGVFYKSHH